MKLPDGQLVRSRVVADLRTVLVDALDRTHTGYAVLKPQSALLLADPGEGILTFDQGVPVVAFHTGTDRGGPEALADLAAEGPYRLELVAAPDEMGTIHDSDRFRVPPGMPAERLAGDQPLADRTREQVSSHMTPRSPGTPVDSPGDQQGTKPAPNEAVEEMTTPAADQSADTPDRPGAVEAFLDNEEKIAAIRESARQEAHQRAADWGFDIDAPDESD